MQFKAHKNPVSKDLGTVALEAGLQGGGSRWCGRVKELHWVPLVEGCCVVAASFATSTRGDDTVHGHPPSAFRTVTRRGLSLVHFLSLLTLT